MLTKLRAKLFPVPTVARPRAGAFSMLAAHALAFTVLAHCHYWLKPPNRLEWFVFEPLLATALWLAGRGPVRRLISNLGPAAGRTAVAAGVGLALWWQGRAADTLWVHAPDLLPLLELLLFASHALLAGLLVAGLLVAVAATDPPPVVPTPASRSPRIWPWLLAFAVTAVGFAAWYVRQEHTIYWADSMFYWTATADWADQLLRSPGAAWRAFRVNVQTDKYTLLPGGVPGLTMAALGDRRLVYVGTVAAVYLTTLFVAVLCFARRTGTTGYVPAVAGLFLLTLPLSWVPVLMGYPDVGGVPLAILSLWLVAGRPREQQRWPHLFGAAAVLVAMVLFRRWYSCWAVGLMAVAGLDAAVGTVRPLLARDRRGVWRAVRPAGVLGVLFPLTLAALAWPMMPTLVGVDYTQILAGYRYPATLRERLWNTGDEIGFGYLLLAAASAAYLLADRSSRRPILFLLGTSAAIVPLFYRMQDPNPHHQYLALPLVLVPTVLAAARWLTLLPRWAAVVALALGTGVGAVNLLGTVCDDWQPVRARLAPLAPTSSHPPATRPDLPEFERLLAFVDAETARTGKPFVVLSSSPALHWSMFKSADRSLWVPFAAKPHLLFTEEVDRVSGFPHGVFRSDLVLVADPTQFHMRPGEQQTVAVPARLLLGGEGLGRAFERLPGEFQLQNGVRVTAHRRTRAITAAEFEAFCELLRQAHPDTPFVYRPALPPEQLLPVP